MGAGASPFGSQIGAEVGHSVVKASFSSARARETPGSSGWPCSR